MLVCVVFSGFRVKASVMPSSEYWPEGVIMHRIQAGIANEAGWYKAVSTDGSFEVNLPAKFEDWSVYVPESTEPAHSVGGTSDEGIKLLVTEFPLLDEIKTADIKTLTTGLLGIKPIGYRRLFLYQGMQALQVKVKVKETRSRAMLRHIITEDRFFQLSIEYPANQSKLAKKLEPLFFDSFKVKINK